MTELETNNNTAADECAKSDELNRPCSGGCCRHITYQPPRGKLTSYDYLADVPGGFAGSEFVEVLFKNTRKGYYILSPDLEVKVGDRVVVEANPGHDVGVVSLTGQLVRQRMRKANIKSDAEIRKVFRPARQADLDKFEEAKARENDVMIRSRKIAESLQLNMKIGDVEFQGDGTKAIFYYIADERVDFRQLIKLLAEAFKIRIEMKQIGARQEAGRIGGIGPCGRPLCCASWMTNFVSVATSAARFQDISLNPQKLAGQCAKLKCCLNFEVDTYVESVKQLPERNIRLETADATYYHFKTDIFKREITYSTERNQAVNLVTIDAERAFEVIEMNRAGQRPAQLERDGEQEPKGKQYNDILDQDNLNRFDNKKRKKKRKERNRGADNRPVSDNSDDAAGQIGDNRDNESIASDRDAVNGGIDRDKDAVSMEVANSDSGIDGRHAGEFNRNRGRNRYNRKRGRNRNGDDRSDNHVKPDNENE